MATSGKSREIKKKQQYLTEPTRGKRHREEEEAGVTKQIPENEENNYNHDRLVLRLSSSVIGKAGKKLCKLQEDIRRKEQKEKSRWLGKCKTDYDYWLEEMVKELKQLMAIVGEREVLHQQKAEIDRLNQQLKRLKEQEQEDRTKNEIKTLDLTRKLESLNQDLKRREEMQEKKEETIKELTRKLDSLNQNLTQQKETEQNNEETNRELQRKLDSLNQDLKQQKETEQKYEETNRELQQKLDSLYHDLKQQKETEKSNEERNRELKQKLDSVKEELSREQEAKLKALTSLEQTLKQEHRNEETTGELNRKLDSLNQDLKQQKETEQKNEERNRELKQKLSSVNEELSREQEAKLKALISSDKNRKLLEETEQTTRALTQQLDSLNQNLRRQKETEQKNEETNRELTRHIDSLNEELSKERESKQDALTRLSAITSSRLRNNNPNLTDLSDPYRPSKIGEMFSELYDNEWTNAYDELNESKSEVETIQQLNAIAMTAYDCCMTLYKPCRSYLNTDLTKIESELRQKIIGHFKRSGMVVIQHLSQGLENDICVRCKVRKATDQVAIYIRKCIAICWLMVIQDPPIVLDNSKLEKFDTSRFKGYMHNGPYTDYVVWPAVNLYKDGPLLSKGVAEGRK